MHSRESKHGLWSSHWVFILAATGSAVGLGNIWKFPYMAGENGGGAFVLVYLVCIALVGVPILMGEVLLGRRGRHSPVYSIRAIALESRHSARWAWLGFGGAVAGFLIFAFYSVVSGWVLAFTFYAANGSFIGAGSVQINELFNSLLADPQALILWHTVFLVSVLGVSALGVEQGLERAIRVLMPTLFVLLLLLLVYGSTSGGFLAGVKFLLVPDFSKLTWNAVLMALGHAFFTLSLGMGVMMVYGSYMPKKPSIAKSAVIIAGLDVIVALVAGLAIFPIVFANQLDPGAGPGLMFVTLPLAFGNMPGGQLFGFVFFSMVLIAAWTSAVSLLEPAVTWLIERFSLTRNNACLYVGAAGWFLGLGALVSFNIGSEWRLLDLTLFDWLDVVTASILLPLGGFLLAIFVGWQVDKRNCADELALEQDQWFGLWYFLIRYVAPVAVMVIFVANLWVKFA